MEEKAAKMAESIQKLELEYVLSGSDDINACNNQCSRNVQVNKTDAVSFPNTNVDEKLIQSKLGSTETCSPGSNNHPNDNNLSNKNEDYPASPRHRAHSYVEPSTSKHENVLEKTVSKSASMYHFQDKTE